MRSKMSRSSLLLILIAILVMSTLTCAAPSLKDPALFFAALADPQGKNGPGQGEVPAITGDPEKPQEVIQPPESGLGSLIQEGENLDTGYTVAVYQGNAQNFTHKPGRIAFANAIEYPSPAGISITFSGPSDDFSYTFFERWVFLNQEGVWIEASTSDAVTAMGVQFWGDTDDGWAEVSLDGVPVWLGNTRGTDENYPGGAYVNYVEVTGLSGGPHTLRVQNAGEGVTTVYFFGIGGLYE